MHERKYRATRATKMLAAGLSVMAVEHKVSLREIVRKMGYRQPIVLSLMATGRRPVPIPRALEIARMVGLPPHEFLMACLEQRYPTVPWQAIFADENGLVEAPSRGNNRKRTPRKLPS